MSLLDCTCLVRALKAGLFETRGWDPSVFGSALEGDYWAELGCFTDAGCSLANASAQYLGRASSAAIEMGDIAYTIGVWFKGPLTISDAALVYKYASFGAQPGEFGITVDAARAVFYLYENPSGFVSVASGPPSANAWHFLLCWHDPVANRIYLQLDNGAVLSTATGNPAAAANPSAPLNVGSFANNSVPSYDWDGSVARFSLHKRVLTSAERTWLYNAGAGRFYADLGVAGNDGSDLKTSLVDYWNLCEKTGVLAGSHAGLDLSRANTPGVAAGPGEGSCVDRSPCKRWEDQSSHARHLLQATIASQPVYAINRINGLPTLRVPAGGGVMLVAGSDLAGLTGITLSALMRTPDVSADNAEVLAVNAVGGAMLGRLNPPVSGGRRTVAWDSAAPDVVATDTPFVGTCRYSASGQRARKNAGADGTSAQTAGLHGAIKYGNAGVQVEFEAARMVVVSGVVSDADTAQLVSYLMTLGGI